LSINIILHIESMLDLKRFNDCTDFFVQNLNQLIYTVIFFFALINPLSHMAHLIHLRAKGLAGIKFYQVCSFSLSLLDWLRNLSSYVFKLLI
jgi:hypothetical protein